MTRHRDTTGPQGSVYTHPRTGETFPSVTTIISGGLPKHALVPWASKVVAEHAARAIVDDGACPDCELTGSELVKHLKGIPNAVRDARAAEGSAVHRAIETYGDLGAAERTDHPAPLVQTWARWAREYEPVFHGHELTVVNRTQCYAGTLDALVELTGWPGVGVVDWKTSKAIYSDVGLQLAAYRHAEVILDDDGTEWQMPPISWAAVLRLDPHNDIYEFKPVDAGELTFTAFLACKDVRLFAQRSDVIGPRIATPQEVEEASPEDRALYREIMQSLIPG